MNKYYKVFLKSERNDIEFENIIVKDGLMYVKEIVTGKRIMKCDNVSQGFMHNYYIFNSELNDDNIATTDDIIMYFFNYTKDFSPSKKEQEGIGRCLKKLRGRSR